MAREKVNPQRKRSAKDPGVPQDKAETEREIEILQAAIKLLRARIRALKSARRQPRA